MKKIIIGALLSVISISGTSASCLYQETPAQCSISGETYTSSCSGWSDTSAWSIPVAYDGACQNTPTLSNSTKKAVSDILYTYFEKKDYIKTETDSNYTISRDGQKFIQNSLFPAIQKVIASEIKKDSPNSKRIALYNELVGLVGYDYYISK